MLLRRVVCESNWSWHQKPSTSGPPIRIHQVKYVLSSFSASWTLIMASSVCISSCLELCKIKGCFLFLRVVCWLPNYNFKPILAEGGKLSRSIHIMLCSHYQVPTAYMAQWKHRYTNEWHCPSLPKTHSSLYRKARGQLFCDRPRKGWQTTQRPTGSHWRLVSSKHQDRSASGFADAFILSVMANNPI